MTRHDAETIRQAVTTLEETGLDQVSWRFEDGRRFELRLVEGTTSQPRSPQGRSFVATEIPSLAQAQAFVRGLVPEGRSVVDELIAERREEAQKEEW